MIRVFRSGAHAHRTPLSYAALAPLFAGQIHEVDRPDRADLYLFGHMLDVQGAPWALVEDWRRRRRPVVILSEEPFWDTIWTRQPLDPLIYLDTAFGTLPVHQINHHTSDVFRFDRIPYYLLTNHRFANAYGQRFARNAAKSARDWQADFAARAMDVSFMFERRPEPHHAVRWPAGDIIGLCSWRTELAVACTTGQVERLGRSWREPAQKDAQTNARMDARIDARRRQDLATDWHLDKLVRMDRRSRALGALENTHQPDYLSEKFFDAFACGALPLYFASPGHRVHDMGLPPESWLNLWDLDPETAAGRVATWVASLAIPQDDSAFLEAFHLAQARLAALFGNPQNWLQERDRLAAALPAALAQVLQG